MSKRTTLTACPDVLPRDFYVYAHRKSSGRVNGRFATGPIVYVGKGIGWRAWNRHNRNPHWQRICRKHGLDVEVMQDGLREWAALELEVDLINRIGRGYLCNLTDGGEGVSGHVLTDSQKKQLSNAVTESWQDAEIRERHVAARLVHWSKPGKRDRASATMKDRLSSPAIRAKMRVANKRHMNDPEIKARHSAAVSAALQTPDAVRNFRQASLSKWADHNCKLRASHERAIRCKDTGQVFRSGVKAMEWVRSLGFSSEKPSAIYLNCKGKNKTAYGHKWEYVSTNHSENQCQV